MGTWNIDSDHSVAGFSVRHMMVTEVHGQFNKLKGEIEFDTENVARVSIAAEIDASGIYTGISKRDDHLKSPEFLDVANHPVIGFKSTAVEKTGSNRALVSGELTIRGVTKPIVFETEFFGPVTGTEDETTIGFAARTRINREDFGLTWNVPLEPDGVMVGRQVRIFIEGEADLNEEG